MQMKPLFLTLCVALALLAGCGRSKPQTAKTAEVDTSALENAATAAPPDQLPPKPAKSAPQVAQPAYAQSSPATSFAPIPLSKDPAAQVERQNYRDARARQAAAVAREKAAAQAAALLNPPQNTLENNDGR